MKRIHNFIFGLSVFFSLSGFVHSDESIRRVLTLKEALQIASEHDIQLLLSEERLVQAVTRIEQNKSYLYPQLSLSASETRQTRDLRASGLSFSSDPLIGPFNTFDARAQLTQTLFDPSIISRLKAAQAGKKLSTAELRKTKEDVLTLVANMFINARRALQGLLYADTVLARESKRLEITQHRIENDLSTDLELKQAQADYDAAVSFQKQMEIQALNTRLDLLSALGLDLNEDIQFSEEDDLVFPESEEMNSDGKDLPDMEVAKQDYLLSQHNHKVAKSEYFPKISALADYGFSGTEPQEGSETYTLGVQATLPLFDGGFRRASVKESESRLRSSEANMRDVKNKTNARIIQIHESVNQAKLLVTEKLSKLDSAQQQLALTQKQLEDGTATDVELLQSTALEAMAKDELNEAKALLVTSQINWAHVLGKMESLIRLQ